MTGLNPQTHGIIHKSKSHTDRERLVQDQRQNQLKQKKKKKSHLVIKLSPIPSRHMTLWSADRSCDRRSQADNEDRINEVRISACSGLYNAAF